MAIMQHRGLVRAALGSALLQRLPSRPMLVLGFVPAGALSLFSTGARLVGQLHQAHVLSCPFGSLT